MKVRSVRRGRAPNCSATGSVVGMALLTAVGAAAVINAFADRFARWTDRGPGDPDGDEGAPDASGDTPVLRREADGAIVAWSDPPALLFGDVAGADAAEAAGARMVGTGDAVPGALSAPTEVHVQVTKRCPVACTGCYLDAGPDAPSDPDRGALEADLDVLAEMGVLEIALGGGEALLRADWLDLAKGIRSRGMVPNLTTSGFGVGADEARAMEGVLGQVNVSIDGLGDGYRAVRGFDGTSVALRALRHLRDAAVRTGVNTVLTRQTLDGLDDLADALVEVGVTEWQWLRFKPSGRGREAYRFRALSPVQAASLHSRAVAIEARTGLTIRFDCALVPFMAASGLPPERLASLGISGCPGGHSLWSRATDGAWSACSFVPGTPTSDVPGHWRADPGLQGWRARAAAPPEPCGTCPWQAVCRGGCRAVSAFLTGDPLAPDPECPRVREARA